MKKEIFAAEINLEGAQLEQKSFVNKTQVVAYLSGLSSHYDEALIICAENHLLFLAIGKSPLFVIDLLNDFVDMSVGILTSSSQNAIEVLMSVAKGKRWTDVPLRDIGRMITSATRLSMESDCFGESLRKLVGSALFANAWCCRHDDNLKKKLILSNPSVSHLDYSKISLN